MEKTLKLRPWDDQAIAAFHPVVDTNPWGPLECAGELLGGSYLFEYSAAGQRALVAARPVALSGGTRVEIVAMRSLGDRLHAKPFCAALVGMGHQLEGNVLAMSSAVPHVLTTLSRNGWTTTGALMIQPIGSHGRTQ